MMIWSRIRMWLFEEKLLDECIEKMWQPNLSTSSSDEVKLLQSLLWELKRQSYKRVAMLVVGLAFVNAFAAVMTLSLALAASSAGALVVTVVLLVVAAIIFYLWGKALRLERKQEQTSYCIDSRVFPGLQELEKKCASIKEKQ